MPDSAPPPTRRPWLVLAIMCAGFFMSLLDGTIVNIAVPSLIHGMNTSYDQVLWIIDAYLLVFSVLLITTGRLGDLYGYRRLFLIGITVFTLGSALCALADTPGQLLGARVVQGLGAATAFPQVISTILATFPPRQRGRAFGVFGVIAGLAPVLGPVAGGLILTRGDWRWIFWINVPIGIVVVALALMFVPGHRERRPHRLDMAGVVVATAGLAGIVFGLIEGERYRWGTVIGPIGIPSIIATGVGLLAGFVVLQRVRRGEPLVPPRLFTSGRNFPVGNGIGFVFQLGMIGIGFVLVVYLQTALGHSALATGLILTPMALLTAAGSAIAGRWSDRIGGKPLLAAGMTTLAVGLVLLVVMSGVDTGPGRLLPGLLVIGLASGATFAPLQQVTMDGVDPRLAGAASGVSGTTRQIGGVLGTALVGAVLAGRLNAALPEQAAVRAGRLPEGLRAEFVRAVTDGGHRFGPPSVPDGLAAGDAARFAELGQEAFTAGYLGAMRVTLLACAAVLVGAAALCLLLPRRPAAADHPDGRHH